VKILFLTDPDWNHGSIAFYTSLSLLLGHENVIDLPYKPSLHGSLLDSKYSPLIRRFYLECYPDNPHFPDQNYSPSFMDSVIMGSRINHPIWHWARLIPPHLDIGYLSDIKHSDLWDILLEREMSILANIDEFDVIFVPPRWIPLWILGEIQKNNSKIPPIVIMDHDDTSCIGIYVGALNHIYHYCDIDLKNIIMYIKFQACRGSKWSKYFDDQIIYPTLMPCPISEIWDYEQRYPFAFLEDRRFGIKGDLNDKWESKIYDLQYRKALVRWERLFVHKAVDILRNTTDLEIRSGFEWGSFNPYDFEITNKIDLGKPGLLRPSGKGLRFDNGMLGYWDYFEELTKSKISIDCTGHASEKTYGTGFQFTEVAANSLLLSNHRDNIYEHPLIDGEHCIYFDFENPNDVIDKVKYFNKNDNEAKEISENAKKFVKKYHSLVPWAQRIMGRLEELKNNHV